MLGISTYFQDLDLDYLKKASALGARYVFTSLHIPEEDYSNLDVQMPVFLETLAAHNLELVPDISPRTFEKLGVAVGDVDALKTLGFKTLRLDFGFDDVPSVLRLMDHFEIVLNASTVDEVFIRDAIAAGIDVSKLKVMHNFYPKVDTGLAGDFFAQINTIFVLHKIQLMAFVTGDVLKRFPLYEGLPTLESHRNVHPYVAAVELKKVYGVEDVLIGDSKASLSTLRFIREYLDSGIMHIPAHFEKGFETLYDTVYDVRKDLADAIVRLITPRVEGVPIFKNNARKRGMITLDNFLSGRYSGEMQIMKKDSTMQAHTNVIGFIHPDYVDLIDYVDRTTRIQFVPFHTLNDN